MPFTNDRILELNLVKDDKLHYAHNCVGRSYYNVESTEPVPEGRHQLRFEFEVTGPPDIAQGQGTPRLGQLYFGGKLVGQVEVPVTHHWCSA